MQQAGSLPLGLSFPAASSTSALLQLCSPRAPGEALYIESIIRYSPHVRSGQADPGQVRILAMGTFLFSTRLVRTSVLCCEYRQTVSMIALS